MPDKYYATTAIAYVNGEPHIGFALELLYADVLARHHRMRGEDVLFLTGTDEHGGKISQAAAKAGMGTPEFTDKMSARFRLMADSLGISNDDFIRTTEERHIRASQELWRRALEAGKIYKKQYTGLYCVGCEAFKTEKELVDGICPDHKAAPEKLEEENYFFRLTDYKDRLLKLFTSRPDFVVPDGRFNEVKGWVEDLQDISVSRSAKQLTWGIPVPNDPDQVMYVWFDALTNYLTAAGFPDEKYRHYWPADVHIIGKEISRFHAVMWPAMLWAAGIDIPKQVAVHGHISVDGQKMSKSLGNVINPFDLLAQYGTEPVRYFLLREMPFNTDGDFSAARVAERYTGDLANGVGNLVSRVLAMIEKYQGGVVPEFAPAIIEPTWLAYQSHLENRDFHLALNDIWDVIGSADKLVNDREPWVLAKTDPSELAKLLYVLAETIRHIAVMLWPFMPETAEKILERLGVSFQLGKEPLAELQSWGVLKAGTKVSKGDALFPRLPLTDKKD
jgi:methionyl-tRNA synthetase